MHKRRLQGTQGSGNRTQVDSQGKEEEERVKEFKEGKKEFVHKEGWGGSSKGNK